MGFRNIIISTPVKLSVKNNQLCVEDYMIPLEDINTLVIENMRITLSVNLINKISYYGIACYICDEKHIPYTVVLPMNRHTRHFQMLKKQIDIKQVFRKRIWKNIVIQKILNQANCLSLLGKEGYKDLEKMSREVQSGDKGNIESKAAVAYFKYLFGEWFVRREDDIVNKALNYGYSIIRGQVIRSIVSHGLEPSLGINHHSQLNSFNLADDLIEPYRALVDIFVCFNLSEFEEVDELTPALKNKLIDLVNYNIFINGGNYTVSKSIDIMVGSFVSCLNGQKDNLILPSVIEMKSHSYE